MTKQEARERMKILRRELTKEERERKNQVIANYLLEFPAMQQETWFFPFVSYGTEVDTLGMLKQILATGNLGVAVPRVEGKEMEFYEITSMNDLKTGYQGILEPVTKKCVPAKEGVMLLPGLAFDREKNRVGYGGGYYDRYLEKYDSNGIITVALAYDFQIVDKIRAEEFDRKPQWIITDAGIF